MFKKHKKLLVLLLLFVLLIGFTLWQTNTLTVTQVSFSAGLKTPIKIVQISDLHGKQFSKDNRILKDKILEQKPDLIAFTGDLYDVNKLNIDLCINFLGELTKTCPVAYIPGNHEHKAGNVPEVLAKLKEKGVYALSNETVVLKIKGQKVTVVGADVWKGEGSADLEQQLNNLEQAEGFKLLLAHYPEDYPSYKNYNFDLMLSGHTHGGQINIPFIGGIFAPGQGLFPQFMYGFYDEPSRLFVSRGLGTSVLPIRLFCMPEIVAFTVN